MQRKKTATVDVASLLFLKGHVWVMRQVKIHPKPTWAGVHWDVNYLGYFFSGSKWGTLYTPKIILQVYYPLR